MYISNFKVNAPALIYLNKIMVISMAAIFLNKFKEIAPIAQLDRASAYGAEGYRFESCWARQSSPKFFPLARLPLKGWFNLCVAHSA